ncbi:hypothetical protein B5S27_g5579 [[Candida] boidinii]|nr:hypothetical protein B5S27_g5579 [[Candida] boidinii]
MLNKRLITELTKFQNYNHKYTNNIKNNNNKLFKRNFSNSPILNHKIKTPKHLNFLLNDDKKNLLNDKEFKKRKNLELNRIPLSSKLNNLKIPIKTASYNNNNYNKTKSTASNNSEDELVSIILNYYKNENFFNYKIPDYTLPELNSNSLIPIKYLPKIESFKSTDSEYVSLLCSFIAKDSPKLEKKLFKTFQSLIDNGNLKIESYHEIIDYMIIRNSFETIDTIITKMLSKGINPDIYILNAVLKAYLQNNTNNTNDSDRFENSKKWLEFLLQKNNLKLKLDLTTLSIILSNIESEKNILKLLNIFESSNLQINQIESKLLKLINSNFISNVFTNKDIPKNLKLNISNIFVEYYLKKKDIKSALKFIDNSHKFHHLKADYKLLNKFVKHFAIENDDLPMAIAFMNLFKRKYNVINNYEAYGYLTKSMRYHQLSENWNLLTRFFYQNSINFKTKKTVLNNSSIELLNNYAKKNGINNFNIENSLTLIETKLINDKIENLMWKDNKPIVNLNKNSKTFKTAASFISDKESVRSFFNSNLDINNSNSTNSNSDSNSNSNFFNKIKNNSNNNNNKLELDFISKILN